MICKKCSREIPGDAVYCCYCGIKQEKEKHRRANGEGTAYKRGDTWTVKVRSKDGKAITKGGFRTRSLAMSAAGELRASLEERLPDTVSFANLWVRFQETKRYLDLSEGKKGAYAIAYKKCSSLEKFRSVNEIRYRDIQPIISGMTYYPARDVKVMLNALFDLACRNEWMRDNPAPMMEIPTLETREKAVFTDDEIVRIAEVAEHDNIAQLVMLGILTGLRPIELRSVTDDTIHLESRSIVGAGHKTALGKQLPVMLSNEALVYAMELKGNIPSFSGDDAFYTAFYELLDRAGIDNTGHRLTPNTMRHTFVTRLTETGVAPATLQKAARHTSYTTTLKYTHIPMDDVLKAVNTVSTLPAKTQ